MTSEQAPVLPTEPDEKLVRKLAAQIIARERSITWAAALRLARKELEEGK